MAFNKDDAKTDRHLLAEELRKAGATNTERKNIRCPYHDDHSPSAEIRQAASGNWNFYCYPCGISADVFELRSRNEGRDVGEILKEDFPNTERTERTRSPMPPIRPKVEPKPKKTFESYETALANLRSWHTEIQIEEINQYTDPDTGECNYFVIRYREKPGGKKKFIPIHQHENGKWGFDHPERLPLFNRVRIKDTESILMVEGEKCVRYFTKHLNFHKETLAASTCPCGSNGPHKTDLSPLAGKAVYVWRDADEPGKKWEESLITGLKALDPPPQIVQVKVDDLDLAQGGDLVDFLEQYRAEMGEDDLTDLVESILQGGKLLTELGPLQEYYEQIEQGKIRNIPFPMMPTLSHQSKAMIPGTVTLLTADPGAGKTWMMTEWFWRWRIEEQVSVKLLMLEETQTFHLNRVLAQISGKADIADLDQLSARIEEFKMILTTYSEQLTAFSKCLEVWGSRVVTQDEIAEWIEEQCKAGVEIIGIDPITAAKTEQQPWVADSKFIMKIKALAEQYQSRIIISTHPRGGGSKPGLYGSAGGLAYTRFCQSHFWVEKFDEPKQSKVSFAGGYSQFADHKLELHIKKARSGIGAGKSIALNFNDIRPLCFHELGLVIPPK